MWVSKKGRLCWIYSICSLHWAFAFFRIVPVLCVRVVWSCSILSSLPSSGFNIIKYAIYDGQKSKTIRPRFSSSSPITTRKWCIAMCVCWPSRLLGLQMNIKIRVRFAYRTFSLFLQKGERLWKIMHVIAVNLDVIKSAKTIGYWNWLALKSYPKDLSQYELQSNIYNVWSKLDWSPFT